MKAGQAPVGSQVTIQEGPAKGRKVVIGLRSWPEAGRTNSLQWVVDPVTGERQQVRSDLEVK